LSKNSVFKIGAATVAAAAGAILAITSVGANSGSVAVRTNSLATHVATAPAVTGTSAISSMVAGLEAKEAAAKLAAQQKKAAMLAARLAKLKAAAAAEAAEANQTPTACQIAAKAEDVIEKANDKVEDTAEKTATGADDAAEDAAEKAADATEDAAEVHCPRTDSDSDHHTQAAGHGESHGPGSASTFSIKRGDH
jgi:hypothetical protein